MHVEYRVTTAADAPAPRNGRLVSRVVIELEVEFDPAPGRPGGGDALGQLAGVVGRIGAAAGDAVGPHIRELAAALAPFAPR